MESNCVFVDEAGFHTQMIRGHAWSKKGDPAVVQVHTQKGVNISIVGCISPFDVINFSKVEKEFSQLANKKRMASTQHKKLPKGTTAYHIVKFMDAVMDTLDKHDKKECLLF